MFLGTSCSSSENDLPYGQRTQPVFHPGDTIIGPGGLELFASKGAFDEPIHVKLWDENDATIKDPLPSELAPFSSFYTIDTNVGVNAHPGEYFSLSIPVPGGIDERDLVMALWIEPGGDLTPDAGEWLVIDGVVDNGRFITSIYILPDRPLHVVFAHGEWFTHDDEPLTTADGAVTTLQQGLTDIPDIRVKCEKSGEDDECTEGQRNYFKNYITKTIEDFRSRRLGNYSFAQHVPLARNLWGATTRFHKVYLRTWSNGGGVYGVCEYGGISGRYIAIIQKLVVCIHPEPKMAPMYRVSSVSPGDKFTLKINGNSISVTAGAVDSRKNIAEKLVTQINANSAFAGLGFHSKSRALAIGDQVAFFFHYVNRERTTVPVITGSATCTNCFYHINFEKKALWTGNHEYFHGLQMAAAINVQHYYLEGTATAAARATLSESIPSLGPPVLTRDVTRPLRRLDVPHFYNVEMEIFDPETWNAEQSHYEGQDFYVYAGRFLNRGIEWIIPMMAGKGKINPHHRTFRIFGYEMRRVYTKYVQNAFVEKSMPLDEVEGTWKRLCEVTTQMFDPYGQQWKEYHYSGGSASISIPIKQYSAGAVKVDFDEAIYNGQSFMVEVAGDGGAEDGSWMLTSIYKEKYARDANDIPTESCEERAFSRSKKVIHVSPENSALYVLGVSSLSDEKMHVSIRPVTTTVSLDSGTLATSSPREIRANYVAEQGPINVQWYLDGVPVGSEYQVYETVGELSTIMPAVCSTAGGIVRVEITDGFGVEVFAEREYDVRGQDDADMSVEGGFFCGGDLYVPDSSDPIIVSLNYACGDDGASSSTSWSVGYPDGFVDTGFGDTVTIDRSRLNEGEVARVRFEDGGGDLLVERRVKLCGLYCTFSSEVCASGVVRGPSYEVRELRDLETIIATFDVRINEIFRGVVPDWLPLPVSTMIDSLGSYVSSNVLMGLQLIETALQVNKSDLFHNHITVARKYIAHEVTDISDARYLTHMVNLVEAHVHRYLPIEAGGASGWLDLDFVKGWKPGEIDPLIGGRAAYSYALAVWLDAFEFDQAYTIDGKAPSLNDPDLHNRALDAAVEGSLRTLVAEHISPSEP